jgi:hypothetical protein
MTTMTIDLDGLIYVEDVECEFDIKIETYEAEPYSWGGSRGTETEIDATLKSVKLGNLVITRDQAMLMFGLDAIKRAESVAEDCARESEQCGEEAA